MSCAKVNNGFLLYPFVTTVLCIHLGVAFLYVEKVFMGSDGGDGISGFFSYGC